MQNSQVHLAFLQGARISHIICSKRKVKQTNKNQTKKNDLQHSGRIS